MSLLLVVVIMHRECFPEFKRSQANLVTLVSSVGSAVHNAKNGFLTASTNIDKAMGTIPTL